MNVTKEILRINAREADRNISISGSWHSQYKDSSYIFIGNIPFELTEGDIICVFSQYGEILNLDLVRNKSTGESKGFAFMKYEDQRSTILAVDNLNGIQLLGRTIRVDHANAEDKEGRRRTGMNAAPHLINEKSDSELSSSRESHKSEDFADKIDPDDPMRDYLINKLKKEKKKEKQKEKETKRPNKKSSTKSKNHDKDKTDFKADKNPEKYKSRQETGNSRRDERRKSSPLSRDRDRLPRRSISRSRSRETSRIRRSREVLRSRSRSKEPSYRSRDSQRDRSQSFDRYRGNTHSREERRGRSSSTERFEERNRDNARRRSP
ncbi:hypothetical protein G9A89_018722 [Geosiphon pyriformis]|nr:hypothetical protein G9A89_018722 [Geosiphon pyriformis]